ncbi:MAG: Ig-like domain-containing protein [Deferrisomatales bacterium]|nr:Ig-like domain-containing protein [Deferrisomatales bacterium]
MQRSWPLLALAGALLLFGCGGDSDDFDTVAAGSPGATTSRGFLANFDLTKKLIPTATDLLLSGTTDLTLNIPVPDPTDFSNPRVAINALDGFSTVAPITTTFASAVDRTSLTPATVRMFEVTLSTVGGTKPVGGPVSGVTRELTFGVEFVATLSSVDPTGSTLAIVPLAPLKPRTSYLVALTSGIKSTDGRSAMSSDNYLAAKGTPHSLVGSPAAALEPVRQLVQAQEAALAAFGMDPTPVVLSWSFTTQSVGVVLNTVRSLVQAAAPAKSVFEVRNPADPRATSPKQGADIYWGTLEVPYYLTAAVTTNDPRPLRTWWQAANTVGGATNLTFANPLPAVTSIQTIPLLASIPKGDKPAAGWPVVIYQHGITSNRATLLAVADSLAAAGFAVVAIDLPLHGLTGVAKQDDPFGAYFGLAGQERTFDLDLIDNTTGLPTPDGNGDGLPDGDGIVDSSGTHMINLASLLTTRDQGRQAVADLFVLTRALQAMDYDGGGTDFNTDEVYFVGMSLGGILGSTFLALEPGVKAATLAVAGGGFGKMFDGSASLGPRLEAGLGTKGILRGTADYESFIGAFQTVADSVDPINYTAGTVAGRGVLLLEVLGDTVVPNNVPGTTEPPIIVGSPTAGTDPMAMYMGLIPVDESTTGTGLHTWVRFTAGHHASLLRAAADPDTNPVPTAEETLVQQLMQTAMVSFLASDGAALSIIPDSGVVEAQP